MARAERCQRQAAAGWVFTSNGALYRGSPRGSLLVFMRLKAERRAWAAFDPLEGTPHGSNSPFSDCCPY